MRGYRRAISIFKQCHRIQRCTSALSKLNGGFLKRQGGDTRRRSNFSGRKLRAMTVDGDRGYLHLGITYARAAGTHFIATEPKSLGSGAEPSRRKNVSI